MSTEQCDCPRGSYSVKHTASCYEDQIERLRAENKELADTAARAIDERQRLMVQLLNLRLGATP